MPRHERPNPDTDPFRPPAIPTEVWCLHCGREYESYLIEWHEKVDGRGEVQGFWCCPTPGCGGKGFGFDIFPTDPEYRGEDGEPMWFDDDSDEDGEFLDEFDFDDDAASDSTTEAQFDDGFDIEFNTGPAHPASDNPDLPPLDLDDLDLPDPRSRRRYFGDDDDIPF